MKYLFIFSFLFIFCTEKIYVREDRPQYLIGKWVRTSESDTTLLVFNIDGSYSYNNLKLPEKTTYTETGIWIVKYLDESNDKILNGVEDKHIQINVINSSVPLNIGKTTYITFNYSEQEIKFLTIYLDNNNKIYFREDTTQRGY